LRGHLQFFRSRLLAVESSRAVNSWQRTTHRHKNTGIRPLIASLDPNPNFSGLQVQDMEEDSSEEEDEEEEQQVNF